MRFSLFVSLVVVTLYGCATVPEPEQNPEQLRATHGFVRVTLPLGAPQGKLLLRAVKNGSEHELRRNEQLGADLFGSWLPAGDYEISELSKPDGSPYVALQVNAGQMTELGGLVPIQLGGYEVVTLPIRHPDIAADAARAIDQLSPYLKTREVQDWNATLVPKPRTTDGGSTGLGLIADLLMDYGRHVNKPPLNQRLKQQSSINAMYKLALTALPPQVEEPAVDEEGNLYFGAELGQVRMRGVDGLWSNLDTGSLQSITAVASSGRTLIAGTSRGVLLANSVGGRQWTQIASVIEGEAVLDIDRVGARWLVVTSRPTKSPHAPKLDHAEQLNIYTTTSNDLSGLTLLRQITLPYKVPLFQYWTPKGQVWGNIYYLNGITDVLQLNTSAMQWSSTKLPHIASTVNVSRKSGTITATLIGGAFSKIHVSMDGGATWLRRDNPSYPIYDVNFDSAEAGVATRWNTGAFSSTIEFVRYDPTQDRWHRSHEGPAGCVRVLRDAAGIQRYCLTSGGSILNYVDGKWTVEFAAN